MSEEIFDVVNERDEVIDHRPRAEVHRLMLKHRAVYVLVLNAGHKVFLQKRSMTKDTHPGVWDSSASGHVDTGEEYDACAVREVGEELGVRLIVPPIRLFKIDACPETDQEFVWLYRCRHEGPFNLHPEEIDGGEWFAAAEIDQWTQQRPHEFAGGFLHLWRILQQSEHRI